jgi:hypothetical protein
MITIDPNSIITDANDKPKSIRHGSRSFRFTPQDKKLIERAMERAGTISQTEALRMALRFYVGDFASPVDGNTKLLLKTLVRDEVARQLKLVERTKPEPEPA